MARKQVIVQLDDDLVKALDREAKQQGVSRSELLRRAATALLEAYEEAEKDRALIESYTKLPQDPELVEALWKMAQETWPPYEAG